MWRNPEFVKLWLGGSISSLGSQVTVLAMPLIAVLSFGAGPAETGLLTAAALAPTLVFGLPAGAWVDRLRRRPVRIATDLSSALVIASVPAAAALGGLRIQQLYVVAFLGGTLTIIARLTTSALLPSIVGRRQLLDANGALITSGSFALIAGPALAGFLVQLVNPPLVLLLDAASYVICAGFFIALREPPAPTSEHPRASLINEITEGLLWLVHERVLFRLTASIGLANLAFFGVQGVMVPFATRELGVPPAELGLALGAMGPTGLLGSVLAAHSARVFGLGPTLVASLSGELLSRILLVIAGGPPGVAVLMLGGSQALFGFIAPLWDVNANSLRQSATPHRLLGRVSAASTFVGAGTAPIGALAAGWLGEVAGPRVAVIAAAAVTLGAVGLLVSSPVPSLRAPPAPRHAD